MIILRQNLSSSRSSSVPIWDCARLLWSVSCLRFYRSRQRPPLRFVISTLPIKTNRKPYISWIVKSLRTVSLELSGITAPGNPLFTLFLRLGEALWGDCLNGKKYRPKDRLNTCYMVMQEVNHQLFTESVLDEVLISMEEANQKRAEEILSRLDLLDFKDRHPMSLSGGQKQRVAIASVIASKRSILFLMNRPAALITGI